MKCPSCGAEATREAVFCPSCGTRLDDGSEFVDEAEVAGNAANSEPAAQSAGARFRAAASRQQGGFDREVELWEGGYSPKAMIGTWVASGAATIALFIVGALWARTWTWWGVVLVAVLVVWLAPLAVLGYRRLSVRYRLTNQRFFHEKGILRRVTDRIEVIDMDDITYEQGIFERLLGVGRIHIVSSDRTHPELWLPGIDDVKNVATMLDNARREERMRRGLHIESV